jgi:hypothetical protein
MFYIYCDESCHLENDGSEIMVIGAMTCPQEIKDEVFQDIRNLKIKHGLSSWFEIKWTKVSDGKLDFYLDLVRYFFNHDLLLFRSVIATGKDKLDHMIFNEDSYDLWYYKMFYLLLDPLTHPTNEYKIFIDVKDTNGGTRVHKLHEVLCNNKYDFNQDVIKDIKQIHSHESEIMQLGDLVIGALSFFHRGLYFSSISSAAKRSVIDEIKKHTGSSLAESTLRSEQKFNLFLWQPRGSY